MFAVLSFCHTRNRNASPPLHASPSWAEGIAAKVFTTRIQKFSACRLYSLRSSWLVGIRQYSFSAFFPKLPPVSLSHSLISPKFSYLHNSTGSWLFFSLSWWASDARIETVKQQALAFIRGMSWEEGRVMVRLHLHLLSGLSSSFARDQLKRAHNGSINLDDGGCREVGRSALQFWKWVVPNGRVWERKVW